MKFMKLGSKPDQFQTDVENIRYVATELATDMVVIVGDVKFYVHKFPLLSKSSRLQKLVTTTTDEIEIHDIPGGPAAFELCAKFCYGMVTTLNAYNVVAARCAAEYLEMYETVEKGNLIYKLDVFLTSSILKSWKDSIIALHTTRSFLPWSEESKIVNRCLDSIAGRASTDPSCVDWSYTYNRAETGLRKQLVVPRDWWVEDLCELQIDSYKRVITNIRAKGKISEDVIGESLKAYAIKWVPFFGEAGATQGKDVTKYSYLVETIIFLLSSEKSCVPCSFLLKLFQASIVFECGDIGRREIMRKISGQLAEASVTDLLTGVCDVDVVRELVEGFVKGGVETEMDGCDDDRQFRDVCPGFNLDDSKAKVARLVDGYLAEASRDSSLPLSKFMGLAEMVSGFPRSSHDGIYRAIDMYLKEQPSLTKNEKKRLCRLMDCKKLSPVACAHAVQNERLPLRVVVQVLFSEQTRAVPDQPLPVRALLPRGSCGSSRSATTTNSDEDWDGDQTSEELKDAKSGADKVTPKKVGKMFKRLWSSKDRRGEMSCSDMSESPASTSGEINEAVKVNERMTANQMQKKLLRMK